jgi:hypothetical protein
MTDQGTLQQSELRSAIITSSNPTVLTPEISRFRQSGMDLWGFQSDDSGQASRNY